ncbi:hypothetical protein LMG27198_19220 [Methylocystis echinoides]|uniref:Uncharacterized protein n=1 Tax=Methylocystis echinoides TaxID=29468 RepID=A0A9W6LRS6_9HYPH|nr:hypothetical protein LMG27198_19220 [Methylocystis echinoides]
MTARSLPAGAPAERAPGRQSRAARARAHWQAAQNRHNLKGIIGRAIPRAPSLPEVVFWLIFPFAFRSPAAA